MEPTWKTEDGSIRLYLGDARAILSTLESGSIDMVLTDPPYGHNNNNNGDLIHRRRAQSPTTARRRMTYFANCCPNSPAL